MRQERLQEILHANRKAAEYAREVWNTDMRQEILQANRKAAEYVKEVKRAAFAIKKAERVVGITSYVDGIIDDFNKSVDRLHKEAIEAADLADRVQEKIDNNLFYRQIKL